MQKCFVKIKDHVHHMVVTEYEILGKPVFLSEKFCNYVPNKMFKKKNKRLIKKWAKRYGVKAIPRTDADIYEVFVLCHPNSAWRFEQMEFIDPGEQE